jgi:YidC/Oxa1 family membrane protein insertase
VSFLQPIGDLFHNVFYEPIYNILMLIYGAVAHVLPGPAFGLAIIVLTLLMRVCLIPLVRKQLRSQRTMQELQPKIAEIKRRYPGDQQAQLAAQQALFKEHGYSPVSGCLPLVIQMPFLYALYYALFAVVRTGQSCTIPGNAHPTHLDCINNDIYSFLPHLAAVPQTHFLWLDLAQKDPTFILPLLAGLLTMVQLRMAMPVRKKTPGKQDATQQATQFTQYLMPVMTFIFGLNFPAGLPLYWSVSTGFSAVQQYFISGWGSLFVGLDRFFPSLKRFIPEPKEPSTPAPALSARGGRVPAAAAMPQPAPGGGGIRGIFKTFRDQMAAAQTQQSQEREAAREGAQAESVAGTGTGGSGARPSAQSRPSARPRRSRADREAPLLVRPSQPAAPRQKPGTEVTPEAAEHAPEGEQADAGTSAEIPPGTADVKPGGSQQLNGARTAANGAARGGPPRTRPGGKGSSTARGRGNRPKGSK